MDESDLTLLSRIRRDDTCALEIVLERHWASVVRYVHSILDSRDAAEDVGQDVFVRLWERREAWKLEGSLRALLFRVARNLALDELRRQSARERAAREAPTAALCLAPDADVENEEIRAICARAVDSLPPRRREVLTLVRHHGLSYREAADVLGLSQQTVANHLTMALADLRELLTPYFYDRAHSASESGTALTKDRSA